MESQEYRWKRSSYIPAVAGPLSTRRFRMIVATMAFTVLFCWGGGSVMGAVIPTRVLDAASLAGSSGSPVAVKGAELSRPLPWRVWSGDLAVSGTPKAASETVRVAYESPHVRQMRSRLYWRTSPFTRQQRGTPIDIPTFSGAYPYDQGPLRPPDWVTGSDRRR